MVDTDMSEWRWRTTESSLLPYIPYVLLRARLRSSTLAFSLLMSIRVFLKSLELKTEGP